MVNSVVFLVSMNIALCLSAEDKSHDVFLTKMEDTPPDPRWITNESIKLNKVNRNRKSLDMNITIMQEMNDNIMCQVRAYQKNGGKYVKAPFDIPKTPCCALAKDNGFIWRCIQRTTNLPESCPVPPGDYQMKGFDPDACDYPKVMPPNAAEDYKIEFIGSVGPEEIFKKVGYGTIKKRIQLV